MTKKEQYIEKVKTKLDEWNADIDKMEANMAVADPDADADADADAKIE